jgi:hypothetical protein
VIPPVVEKSKGVFVLAFENEFIFQPDTLVTIAQRILDKTGLSKYTVTVYNCLGQDIVYGFEMNPPDNNIMACRGRVQPKACYNIEIAFADFPTTTVPFIPIGVVLGGLSLVLAFVLVNKTFSSTKSTPLTPQNISAEGDSSKLLTIGKFAFDVTNQTLRMGDETVVLTDKESKILILLNRNRGQLTPREELIQDVWTDEGVITGRSLDMFISRLRKKLSADADLRITNVHGKGYKLEVS